jgi:hypothetical protein
VSDVRRRVSAEQGHGHVFLYVTCVHITAIYTNITYAYYYYSYSLMYAYHYYDLVMCR